VSPCRLQTGDPGRRGCQLPASTSSLSEARSALTLSLTTVDEPPGAIDTP